MTHIARKIVLDQVYKRKKSGTRVTVVNVTDDSVSVRRKSKKISTMSLSHFRLNYELVELVELTSDSE